MLESIVSSFILVAASEMGDKTQLLAFSLAARFKRPWVIMAGIFVATLVNHGLASGFGSWISENVSTRILGVGLAVTFVAFGFWTLKPDEIDEKKTALVAVWGVHNHCYSIFLAEMGDKTQLATVALGARFHSLVAVTLGTTMGMLVSDGIAVFIGEKLAEKLNMKIVRGLAAALFFLFGIVSGYTALK